MAIRNLNEIVSADLGIDHKADKTEITNLVGSAPATLDTLGEIATAITTISSNVGTKAPLASPALTGTPTAPTAAANTNSTQLATTAFVNSAVSANPSGVVQATAKMNISAANLPITLSNTGQAETFSTITTSTLAEMTITTAAAPGGCSVYDSDRSQAFYIYFDDTNNTIMYATIGNDSGNVFKTSSGIVAFSSYVTTINNNSRILSASLDPITKKIVVAFYDVNGYISTTVGTISGPGNNDLTFTTPVQLTSATNSSISNITVNFISGSKVVLNFTKNIALWVIVGTLSGTTLTFDTPVSGTTSATYLNSTYDSVNDKVIVAWTPYNQNYISTSVVSVSGTVPSYGTAVTAVSTTSNRGGNITYNKNTGKVIVVASSPVGNSNEYGVGISVGTVTGSAISFGTTLAIAGSTIASTSATCIYDYSADRLSVVLQDSNTTNSKYFTLKITNDTPVLESTTTLTGIYNFNHAYSNSSDNPAMLYFAPLSRVVLFYYSSAFKMVAIQSATTTGNPSNFLGFSKAPASSGAVLDILSTGSVSTQVGLTPNSVYYLTTAGTLTTSYDSTSVKVGRALSSTKLLVDAGPSVVKIFDNVSLTGVPVAPTAVAGTNTTQVATTEFVVTKVDTAVSSINKTSLGLGSVDNTSDAAKPVSTAQLTALNLKAPLASPTFTGVSTLVGIKETKVAMAANIIDLATGTVFSKTISGATTLTVSNIPASGLVGAFILNLTNGGSAVITWFSGVKWVGGTAPTLTSAGRDRVGFITEDGGTTWDGFVMGKDLK